jgi:hypothetical protein
MNVFFPNKQKPNQTKPSQAKPKPKPKPKAKQKEIMHTVASSVTFHIDKNDFFFIFLFQKLSHFLNFLFF